MVDCLGMTNQQLADKYANKGTVKHFVLRQGFMPHDEQDAEIILLNIIAEWEKYENERNR